MEEEGPGCEYSVGKVWVPWSMRGVTQVLSLIAKSTYVAGGVNLVFGVSSGNRFPGKIDSLHCAHDHQISELYEVTDSCQCGRDCDVR